MEGKHRIYLYWPTQDSNSCLLLPVRVASPGFREGRKVHLEREVGHWVHEKSLPFVPKESCSQCRCGQRVAGGQLLTVAPSHPSPGMCQEVTDAFFPLHGPNPERLSSRR